MNPENEQYGQWLNILKWSISQSDGTSENNFDPMSTENKEWLSNAMKELVKDEPSRLLQITQELVKLLESEFLDISIVREEEIQSLLDELRDITEQIDMAQLFVKYGGIKCILGLISAPQLSESIRGFSASVISTVSQNNITVQEELYQKNVLDDLYSLYMKENILMALKNKVYLILFLLLLLFLIIILYFIYRFFMQYHV